MSMAMSSGTGLEYVVYVRSALETAIECATQRLTVIDPEESFGRVASYDSCSAKADRQLMRSEWELSASERTLRPT